MNDSQTARRTRRLVALVAMAGAATVTVAWRLPTPAAAHETTVDTYLDCNLGGRLGVTYTVSHMPSAGAVAGEEFVIDIDTGLAVASSNPIVGVNGVTITIPSPPGVAWHGFTTTGGTFSDPVSHLDNGALVIGLTAKTGTTSTSMVLPHLNLIAAIPAEAAGQTITFSTPTELAFALSTSPPPVIASCTGGTTLLTTKVAANPGGTVPPGTRPRPIPTRDTLPVPPGPGSTTTTTKPGGGAAPAEPVPGTPHYAG